MRLSIARGGGSVHGQSAKNLPRLRTHGHHRSDRHRVRERLGVGERGADILIAADDPHPEIVDELRGAAGTQP
jgi:hypothetical protein